MKRLQLDYFDSSSREEQFRDVIDGGKSQSNPQKGLRISVISH